MSCGRNPLEKPSVEQARARPPPAKPPLPLSLFSDRHPCISIPNPCTSILISARPSLSVCPCLSLTPSP